MNTFSIDITTRQNKDANDTLFRGAENPGYSLDPIGPRQARLSPKRLASFVSCILANIVAVYAGLLSSSWDPSTKNFCLSVKQCLTKQPPLLQRRGACLTYRSKCHHMFPTSHERFARYKPARVADLFRLVINTQDLSTQNHHLFSVMSGRITLHTFNHRATLAHTKPCLRVVLYERTRLLFHRTPHWRVHLSLPPRMHFHSTMRWPRATPNGHL